MTNQLVSLEVLARERYLLDQIDYTPAEKQPRAVRSAHICRRPAPNAKTTGCICSRNQGHSGPHVACPGHDLNLMIVALWSDTPKGFDLPKEA